MEKKTVTDFSVLEGLIMGLSISEKQRADLLSCLRRMGLNNDNDPVLEITIVIGLLTKLTSEIPAKLQEERIASIRDYKQVTSENLRILSDLADFLAKLKNAWTESVAAWEVKRRVTGDENAKFVKKMEAHNDQISRLVDKIARYNDNLEVVSICNVLTGVIASMFVIVLFKFLRWL